MEFQTTGLNKRQGSYGSCRKMFTLTIAGGAAFWAATIVTSVLPLAARYRAAFSNWSIQTVWIASLPMGLMIGCCVSFVFLRMNARIPVKRPILKAVAISCAALVIAEILTNVQMILRTSSNSLYYFLVGIVFDAARFLFLGFTVGSLYRKLFDRT